MDGYTRLQRKPLVLGALFAEDFDLASVAPEPEVIEPVFSASEMAGAREVAWHGGHAAGFNEATAAEMACTRRALEVIASKLDGAREAAIECAEQSAGEIARLLLDSLAAIFPMLCSHCGEAEVQAIVRAVLPALDQEPSIIVRVNPDVAGTVANEIAQLDPEAAARVQVSPCDTMSPGDIRIAWHNGAATRNTASLWQQVAAILMPAGLLRHDTEIMETVDGE